MDKFTCDISLDFLRVLGQRYYNPNSDKLRLAQKELLKLKIYVKI